MEQMNLLRTEKWCGDSMNEVREAIESLYEDTCTIIEKKEVTDPQTHVTGFQEVMILNEVPCRLSIQNITITGSERAATQTQTVKLFIAPEVEVKPGSKLIVKHKGTITEYKRSGFPAMHTNHQEIMLDLFDGYA